MFTPFIAPTTENKIILASLIRVMYVKLFPNISPAEDKITNKHPPLSNPVNKALCFVILAEVYPETKLPKAQAITVNQIIILWGIVPEIKSTADNNRIINTIDAEPQSMPRMAALKYKRYPDAVNDVLIVFKIKIPQT